MTPRIAYSPYAAGLDAPGDRRRFPYYARKRGLPFEVYRPGERYDLHVLTFNGDLSLSRERARGQRTLFEMADSYLSARPGHVARLVKGPVKRLTRQWSHLEWSFRATIERTCRVADAIVCSTPEQRSLLSRYNDNVHDILDFHGGEIERTKQDYAPSSPVRLVWEGVGESLLGFESIAATLARLARLIPFELYLVTDLEFRRMNHLRRERASDVVRRVLPGVTCVVSQWSRGLVSALATACDLAVLPMRTGDAMALAKPENRLLLFWRMGVPAVTSSTPAYDRVMTQAGIEASFATPDEWYRGLERHLSDAAVRAENATRGRAYVATCASEEILLAKWDRAMETVS